MTENQNVAPLRVHSVAPGEHRVARRDEAFTMLNKYVNEAKDRAAAVLQQIERQVPTDMIAPAKALRFGRAVDHDADRLTLTAGDRALLLHDNALQQVCGKLDVPIAYGRKLLGHGNGWGTDLLAHNLNELAAKSFENGQRFLIRSVQDEARGFLSDRYRRLDTRPIVDALLGAINDSGAAVVDGYAGEVRLSMRAILPRVIEPVPGEVMVFGIDFQNSDFGCGALEVKSFAMRVWCVNAATMEDAIHQVHLGKRLNDSIEYSAETYRLDTEAMTSAVRDIGRYLLGAPRVDELGAMIKKAAEDKIDAKAALARVRTRLTKGEAEELTALYNSPEVELLPAGNTAWRFSNAVSLLANKTEDGLRRLQLQDIAGQVVAAAAA
jgi:hypothetical protein